MNEDIREEKMSPKSWEKWIHSLNFGRVYYWIKDSRVMPVHFGNYLIDVPCSTFYSKDEREEITVGGYERISKKYKKAMIHDPIDLIDDFIGINRKEYNNSKLYIPKSKIWHDKLAKWW